MFSNAVMPVMILAILRTFIHSARDQPVELPAPGDQTVELLQEDAGRRDDRRPACATEA